MQFLLQEENTIIPIEVTLSYEKSTSNLIKEMDKINMKPYTLYWTKDETTNNVIGGRYAIINLYDILVDKVDNDNLIIYGKFNERITRKQLEERE